MNEIKEKFYKTFDIKPKYYDACTLEDKYWNEQLDNQYGTFDSYLSFECPHYGEGCYSTCEYAYDRVTYPEITDRILLELICILNKFIMLNFSAIELNKLKDEILEECIKCMTTPFWDNFKGEQNRKKLKHQVQSLFTEGEE